MLEYESFLVIITIIVDIIIGSINHIFVKKDNVSSLAEYSIAKKLAIVVSILAMLFIVHLNDFAIFDSSTKILQDSVCALFATVIFAFLYYEFTSVIKHISIITNIDLSSIPGVKSEIESMKEKITKKDEENK